MGVNTLSSRSNSQVIDETWYNDFNTALGGDFVGRNAATGAPASGQNLGTVTYPWGTARVTELIVDGSLVDFSSLNPESHKVISGKTRTTSAQPAFITPNGAAASCIIAGGTTDLLFEVNGQQGEITSDLSVTGLSTAPSSNNTCLVNDANATNQEASRTFGEGEMHNYDQVSTSALVNYITIDTVGSEISALVGKFAGFKLTHSGNDEYFVAYVASATQLSLVRRGFFYNSSLAPVNRLKVSDNDVITLMKLTYLFADIDGTTVDKVTTQPIYAASTPSGPATGDYWFDLSTNNWKRYNGSAYVTVDRVFIGWVLCDSSNCVAARCVPFHATYSEYSALDVNVISNTVVRSTYPKSAISVAGNLFKYRGLVTWDMTTDLAAAADMYDSTEQASRFYYMYVTETGARKISDISPYWEPEMRGFYHPHHPWRAISKVSNDGSSNFGSTGYRSFQSLLAQWVVDFPHIAAGAIRGSNIADNTISAGKYVALSIATGDLADNAVTRAKTIVPKVFGPAGDSGAYSNNGTSGSKTQVTNFSIASVVVPNGSRVWVQIIPNGNSDGHIGVTSASGFARGLFELRRDGTPVHSTMIENSYETGSTENAARVRVPSAQMYDDPGAGTYTYSVYAWVSGAGTSETIVFNDMAMWVWVF